MIVKIDVDVLLCFQNVYIASDLEYIVVWDNIIQLYNICFWIFLLILSSTANLNMANMAIKVNF